MATSDKSNPENEGTTSPHPMRRVGPRRREDIGKPASSDLPTAIASGAVSDDAAIDVVVANQQETS